MFGNNAFGALAMDSSPSNAGPSNQVVEGDEVDVSVSYMMSLQQQRC